MLNFYKPEKCSWNEALSKAKKLTSEIGALRLIEIRVAYGGCFIAKYYMGSKLLNRKWIDSIIEIKIYDNTPFIPKDIK